MMTMIVYVSKPVNEMTRVIVQGRKYQRNDVRDCTDE